MKLIDFLVEHKDEEDEIAILDDYSDSEDTKKILDATVSIYEIKFEQRHLLEDFAGQKNHLRRMCTGDYIFNIDADEMPNKWLVKNIKAILSENPTIDLYYVPRVNTVSGITDEHIKMWGWSINEFGWVNWPDYQGRISRNRPNIVWKNRVHERLSGFKEYTHFPKQEKFCFYHHKDIEKQENSNEFYGKIVSNT